MSTKFHTGWTDGVDTVTGDVWEFTTQAAAGGAARAVVCIIT